MMKNFLCIVVAMLTCVSMPFTCMAMPQENKTVTISFTGDCTLGGFKGQGPGNQFKDYYEEYGNEYFFKNVTEIFQNDDITFVNLEGALTSHPQVAEKKFPIKGEPEYVDILKAGSIEAVGMENNHTYDCGKEGYAECVSLLDEAGIKNCGGTEIAVVETNSIKVGMASVSCWSNSEAERNTAKEAIDKIKAEGCQIVCVMFHGGIEREYQSNQTTEGFAHFLIDNGADIVVGAHPHVLQGIERYKGKIICYSLGNFSFGANKNPDDKDCFILQQDFVISGGNVDYGETKVIPCKISSVDNKNDYCPTVQTGTEAERILNKIKKYSAKYEDSVF